MAMSPGDTAGLDQFEIGEGISPGGNPELLDSLIDIADENSPRGPGLERAFRRRGQYLRER